MTLTASMGYLPLAVSPDNMTQSAPSRTALATSEISARVGRGLFCLSANIWAESSVSTYGHGLLVSFFHGPHI
jgi:hypothetical protein